jgi:CHAT domain-containing protein
MRAAVFDNAALCSSDATMLVHLRLLRITAEALLSAVRQDPAKLGAAYTKLWKSRAPLLTVLRHRHNAAIIARQSDSALGRAWDRLIAVRRDISRQLTQPVTDIGARDKILGELGDEQVKLQRDLAALLPSLGRDRELVSLTPQDLAAKLPEHCVFVEFIRYFRWHMHTGGDNYYAAFVVVFGQEPVVVDLDKAQPIDDAINSWRTSINRREASTAPTILRKLVWNPVAHYLPDGTTAIYLCPDGNLTRLPFAAMPGNDGQTVLLDDFALAVVPSGPYLLEQLLHTSTYTAAEELFAAGDIAYGNGVDDRYSVLGETGREAKRVCGAFGLEHGGFLSGSKATPKAVAEGLCTARYAHLATHGYFDADSLTEERQRFNKHLKEWQGGFENSRVSAGMRNPLGYVGLALANANEPRAGGILTGLEIVNLPLEGLKLCVLSACETGLGELTEGEGVAGLQRAFHVAGCPNVIGSLWNVNDKATAALMAQFYHEHRVNKKPIIEALRLAQLTVYRHPERIDELAGDRARMALEREAGLGAKVG